MNLTADTAQDKRIEALIALPFDRLPAAEMIRVFGVEYVRLVLGEGHELYLTEYGWPHLRKLLPENWYAHQRYSRVGERLPDSTGHVYRVPTDPAAGTSIDVVVKFSRVGQEVPLEIATNFPDHITPVDIANARFNSPMEEFGLVMELRRGLYGPKNIHFLTQRPLAIYIPPEQFETWQLGRSQNSFSLHQRMLYEDSENADKAIELDIRRDYVMLYSWIKGVNAEQAFLAGDLDTHEFNSLTRRVIEKLRAKGFRVLDNKPKHFIVRRRHNQNQLIHQRDKLVYGLVDFELLERTAEYQQEFKYSRRAQYWQLQNFRHKSSASSLPPHLKHMKIFGVDYIYGVAPNGGKVWVVGDTPELFDYFLPDRWRRTPRLKLALTSEVYRTKTRDNIHVVYRRSRVGERPYVDPFYEQGQRIREQGYNSPFEEIGVAEALRKAGIAAVYPRAIYRTGHESSRAGYLHDERRYITHCDLRTPEDEPILSSQHDYYTIWGYYRGVDPHKYYRPQGHWGFIDVEKAFDDGLLSQPEYYQIVQNTRQRLNGLGLSNTIIDDYQFILLFGDKGALLRNACGEPEVVWSIDALTAYEYHLIDESLYRSIVEREKSRLDAAGFDAANLGGNHLLLTMTPQGQIKTDDSGELQVNLCNFELLRLRYCTLRDNPCSR